MLSKDDLSDTFEFPAYSSESTNNGIIGYTDFPEFICNDEHPILSHSGITHGLLISQLKVFPFLIM